MSTVIKERPQKGKIRISVSLTDRHYKELERIAQGKRVSIAWVVRDAVDCYLEKDVPLFRVSGVKVN